MAIVVKISQWLASPEQVAQIAPWSLALRESWLHGTRTTQTCVSHSASKRVRTILGNFLVLPETGIGSLKTRYRGVRVSFIPKWFSQRTNNWFIGSVNIPRSHVNEPHLHAPTDPSTRPFSDGKAAKMQKFR